MIGAWVSRRTLYNVASRDRTLGQNRVRRDGRAAPSFLPTGEPMSSELVWFNGEIMPMADARVGVEDRGYQFADGVYEVVRLYNGKPFTLREHLDRLQRS